MEEALSRSRYVLLKNEKNYWKSTLGQMFSRCGDGIDTIAFSILIYEITGSTLQVATLFAVNGLPNLIFGMISGVVTQHKSEKVILSICDFGRGLCAFLTAVLYLTGWIRGWQLYIITFLNSSFESFRAPATASVTPKILNKENMDAGIALQTSATKLLEVLGLAVAPALIGLLGLGSAIAIDSILFMICGVFSVTLHLPKVEQEKMTLSNSVNDLKQGFSYLVKRKQLVNICIFTCLINIVFIPINVFQVPYVQDQLHGGNSMSDRHWFCSRDNGQHFIWPGIKRKTWRQEGFSAEWGLSGAPIPDICCDHFCARSCSVWGSCCRKLYDGNRDCHFFFYHTDSDVCSS